MALPQVARASHVFARYTDAEELFQLASQGGASAVRVIRRMLKHGMSANAVMRRSFRLGKDEPITTEMSALHAACARGHVDVAVALLQAKADVDLPTGNGLSALHLAIRAPSKKSRRGLCAALLDAGANLEAQDARHGRTPVEAAERRHGTRSRIASFLRNPPDADALREEFSNGLGVLPPATGARGRPVTGGLSAAEMKALAAQLRRRSQLSHNHGVVSDDAQGASSDEEDDCCGICLGVLVEGDNADNENEIWHLPCGGNHAFHAACLRPWLQRAGACPTCRCKVTVASARERRYAQRW